MCVLVFLIRVFQNERFNLTHLWKLLLRDKDEDKYDNRLVLPIISTSKLPVRIVMVKLKSLNKLRFSLQLKNGGLEALELVALFLLKTGTLDPKNAWEFFVDAVFCFVKIFFVKGGTVRQFT